MEQRKLCHVKNEYTYMHIHYTLKQNPSYIYICNKSGWLHVLFCYMSSLYTISPLSKFYSDHDWMEDATFQFMCRNGSLSFKYTSFCIVNAQNQNIDILLLSFLSFTLTINQFTKQKVDLIKNIWGLIHQCSYFAFYIIA